MKYILILTVVLIGYILFLDEEDLLTQTKKVEEPRQAVYTTATEGIDPEEIRRIVKSLPINEIELPKIGPAKKETDIEPRQEYKEITLKGTIYGSEQATAMLVKPNGETIYVKMGETVPGTFFKVIAIERQHIVVEGQGERSILKMQK